MKRRLLPILAAAVLLLGLSCPVLAADLAAEAGERSLVVTADYFRPEIDGPELRLYYVGTWDSDQTLRPEGDFARYADQLTLSCATSEEARETARTLAAYAEADGLAPFDQRKPDEQGACRFSGLYGGVWLLTAGPCSYEGIRYITEASLILVPQDTDVPEEMKIVLKFTAEPETEQPLTLMAVKVWNDSGKAHNRPAEITLALLENGLEVEQIRLNAAASWRHTWTDLNPESVWTVVERDIPGDYTAAVTREGNIYTLVNTIKPDIPTDPTDPSLPRTGMLLWPIPVLISLGVLLLIIGVAMRIRRLYESSQNY